MTTALTQAIARLLLLPTFVMAIAVLVKGYMDVGDGFAGGIIAAVGVLLQYVAFGRRSVERLLPFLRYASIIAYAGLTVSLSVLLTPLIWGRPLLTHVPVAGAEVVHLGALELHSALLFDIGVFSLVFGFSVSIIHFIAERTNDGENAE